MRTDGQMKWRMAELMVLGEHTGQERLLKEDAFSVALRRQGRQ